MTTPRRLLVDENLTPWYHCLSRCVRSAFLCGGEFEHRKDWIDLRLKELVEIMSVECAGFATMDNHLHVLVRLNSPKAAGWSPEEVARRWARLYPPRGKKRKPPPDLETWVQSHAQDEQWVAETRKRLASLSWFMKLLKEPIARRANRDDDCRGAFWEGRFRSIAILSDEAVLAVSAYIDLNPFAAGLGSTPEESPHTSLHARIEHCRQNGQLELLLDDLSTRTDRPELEEGLWLLPINDRREERGDRAGLLPGFTLANYLRLVDWTSRLYREGKAQLSDEVSSIFERLRIDADRWEKSLLGLKQRSRLVGHFFGNIAGLKHAATWFNKRWLKNLGTREAAIG